MESVILEISNDELELPTGVYLDIKDMAKTTGMPIGTCINCICRGCKSRITKHRYIKIKLKGK